MVRPISQMLNNRKQMYKKRKKAHHSIGTKCVVSVASWVAVPIFSAIMFVNIRYSIEEFREPFGWILEICKSQSFVWRISECETCSWKGQSGFQHLLQDSVTPYGCHNRHAEWVSLIWVVNTHKCDTVWLPQSTRWVIAQWVVQKSITGVKRLQNRQNSPVWLVVVGWSILCRRVHRLACQD